jgi:HemY protein
VIRRIASVFGLLLLSGVLGTLIAQDPGYVLVSWNDLSFETSLWFGLVLLLVLFFVVRLLRGGYRALTGTGAGVRAWTSRRMQRRAQRLSTQGLLSLAEGEPGRAYKLLMDAAPRVETPLVNYLAAARAAHDAQRPEDRDAALEQALEVTPAATLAVGLTRAELLMANRQWEQALSTLLPLRAGVPRNLVVLRMLRRVYEQLEDWRALAELVPDLKRAGVVEGDALDALERRTWRAELARAAALARGSDDPTSLEALWRDVPRHLHSQPEMVAAYAQALMSVDADAQAESVLRSVLRKHWDEGLVALYGRVRGADARAQLRAAQGWIDDHRDDAVLLLTLGRLALRCEDWDKAQAYLEASLAARDSAEAHAELGRFEARRGDGALAARHFLDGLRLQPGYLPELPGPDAAA